MRNETRKIVARGSMVEAVGDAMEYLTTNEDAHRIVAEAASRWLDVKLQEMLRLEDGHTAYCAALENVRLILVDCGEVLGFITPIAGRSKSGG